MLSGSQLIYFWDETLQVMKREIDIIVISKQKGTQNTLTHNLPWVGTKLDQLCEPRKKKLCPSPYMEEKGARSWGSKKPLKVR